MKQVNYAELLTTLKGDCFVPTGIDTYSGRIWILLSCMQFFRQHDHLSTTECYIHHHGIQYSIFIPSNQRNSLHSKVQQWTVLM